MKMIPSLENFILINKNLFIYSSKTKKTPKRELIALNFHENINRWKEKKEQNLK